MWIFFSSKYYGTEDPPPVESVDAEPWIRRAHYKLYVDFPLVV